MTANWDYESGAPSAGSARSASLCALPSLSRRNGSEDGLRLCVVSVPLRTPHPCRAEAREGGYALRGSALWRLEFGPSLELGAWTLGASIAVFPSVATPNGSPEFFMPLEIACNHSTCLRIAVF